MKKKKLDWVITVLLLAVNQALFSVLGRLCVLLFMAYAEKLSYAGYLYIVISAALSLIFVSVCAVIAVKRSGAAATAWFAVMAAFGVATSLLYRFNAPLWLKGNDFIRALQKFAFNPLPDSFIGGPFLLPFIVYAALAATSARLSRRRRAAAA